MLRLHTALSSTHTGYDGTRQTSTETGKLVRGGMVLTRYAATRPTGRSSRESWQSWRGRRARGSSYPIELCARYMLSRTEVAYGGTREERLRMLEEQLHEISNRCIAPSISRSLELARITWPAAWLLCHVRH